MRKKLITFGIAACLAVPAFSGTAFAAPGANGNGVGGCIDNLYGNATNARPSGNGVLPSQSPGPWVNNDGFGLTVGDVHQAAHDIYGAPAGNYTGQDVNQAICLFP
jgi:hypothetical protein